MLGEPVRTATEVYQVMKCVSKQIKALISSEEPVNICSKLVILEKNEKRNVLHYK